MQTSIKVPCQLKSLENLKDLNPNVALNFDNTKGGSFKLTFLSHRKLGKWHRMLSDSLFVMLGS